MILFGRRCCYECWCFVFIEKGRAETVRCEKTTGDSVGGGWVDVVHDVAWKPPVSSVNFNDVDRDPLSLNIFRDSKLTRFAVHHNFALFSLLFDGEMSRLIHLPSFPSSGACYRTHTKTPSLPSPNVAPCYSSFSTSS